MKSQPPTIQKSHAISSACGVRRALDKTLHGDDHVPLTVEAVSHLVKHTDDPPDAGLKDPFKCSRNGKTLPERPRTQIIGFWGPILMAFEP